MIANSYCYEGWPSLTNRYAESKPYCTSFLFTILGVKPSGRCPTEEVLPDIATLPREITVQFKPLVSEYPPTVTPLTTVVTTPTPTSTTPPTPTMVTYTVTGRVTVERTITLPGSTTTVFSEQPVTDWTITAVTVVTSLIVGIGAGYLYVLGRNELRLLK